MPKGNDIINLVIAVIFHAHFVDQLNQKSESEKHFSTLVLVKGLGNIQLTSVLVLKKSKSLSPEKL